MDFSPRGPANGLTGRRAECCVLDALIEAVRAGQSRILVVHGEPGVGKSALLDYFTGQAAAVGCCVLRVSGVQSEMELAFAGVHQLCAQLLGRLDALPGPQRAALATAFGMSAGPTPDRFLVGLAVLGLLSEVAGKSPVVCVADDVQWLDTASAQVLAFVARRLEAESVGLVFGARVAGDELAGLPELAVEGLADRDARALLNAALSGPVDARVRDEIVAETRGNPLALLELPRGMTLAELAGGFGLPGALPLAGRIEGSFQRQIGALPAQSRRLLLVAAADPTGDPVLIWRAARRLGIGTQSAAPVAETGLAEFSARVRFRHPLVRSAVYQSASARDRQEAHRVLAEATDPQADPDRRAWHRAQAAAGPDEDVAAELERSAGRAQARGGLAAAAAFLEHATALTPDPARRNGRTLAAAQAHLEAGAFGKARELLTMAEAEPLDELQGAETDWLRGQIASASGLVSEAPQLLLQAAKRLEPLDPGLARETYLDAWRAAQIAGHLTVGGDLLEVSHTARAMLEPSRPLRPAGLLLDGLSLLVTDGPAAAAPVLWRAKRAFAGLGMPVTEQLRWGWMAPVVGGVLWDDDGYSLIERPVQLARDTGALDRLPMLLNQLASASVWWGDFAAATTLIAEANTVCEATGAQIAPYAAMRLASAQGRQEEAIPLIHAAVEEATAVGQGVAMAAAYWAHACLYNGLGWYQEALPAARLAVEGDQTTISMWALPELVEAASHTGNTQLASDALDQLAEWTQASGTDWGLGVEARCRALVSDGEQADHLYEEAITRLGRTRIRPELARCHLLYGEWLSRQQRPAGARDQLRTACHMLDDIGMEAFAERARRELRATGATRRRRVVAVRMELTTQEAQIARLAADGLSNPEIGVRLFLSRRTVQYHLGKVFTKLGITSRAQLSRALSRS
jgi:DNA-binding CsgD family transcriptional regulator